MRRPDNGLFSPGGRIPPNRLWNLILVFLLLAGCAGSPAVHQSPAGSAATASQAQGAGPGKWTKEQKQWYRKAAAARKAGNWSTAAQWLAKLTRARPDPVLEADYGLALQKVGREQDAKRAYRKALSLDPGQAMAANNLALLLRDQGHFKKARALLERAIQANPGQASLHYNLAVICDIYLLDRRAAIQQYQAYQQLLKKPDRRVAGWIAQLQREVN